MHVEIEHKAKGGGFWSGPSRHVVSIRVDLSDDERSIVRTHGLWKYVVIKEKNPFWTERDSEIMNEYRQYDIQRLCKGVEANFHTPLDAKNFAERVRENIKALKDFIEANRTPGRKETFDL